MMRRHLTFGKQIFTKNLCAIFRFMAKPGKLWAQKCLRMDIQTRTSSNVEHMAKSTFWVYKKFKEISKKPKEKWTRKSTRKWSGTKKTRDISIRNSCKIRQNNRQFWIWNFSLILPRSNLSFQFHHILKKVKTQRWINKTQKALIQTKKYSRFLKQLKKNSFFMIF